MRELSSPFDIKSISDAPVNICVATWQHEHLSMQVIVTRMNSATCLQKDNAQTPQISRKPIRLPRVELWTRTQGHACAAVRQRADSDVDIDDGMETGKWLQLKLVQEELEFRQKVEFKVHPRYASVERSARGALGMRSRHAHSACMHLSVSAYECTCGDTCREHARS